MRVLSHLLLRAPLLPARVLDDAQPFDGTPLGPFALRLASPTLAAYADGERATRARRHYGLRAAFRATPHGLLAGVAVARVSDAKSRVITGTPHAHLALSFVRAAALGRALLSTDAGWKSAKLRRSPSLVRDDQRVQWIAFGDGAEARREEAPLDELLADIIGATEEWASAPKLARRVARLTGDAESALTLLLELVDDGLLHHDLDPPLVGRAPDAWARERLVPSCPELAPILDGLASSKGAEQRALDAERGLSTLPGTSDAPALATVLCHDIGKTQIARAPLQRAAELAPILFGIADALSSPLAERALVPGLDAAIDAAGALVGEGLLPSSALELGHYGATITAEAPSEKHALDGELVAYLAGQIVDAARAGQAELVLSEAALAARVASIRPATFELQLAPCTPPAGDRDGTDWLLGVHGPAGASWGRYANALGAPMHEALAELARAEASVDGDALRVDVAYAPSRELGDLCQTPSLRAAALAISSWPDEGALTPELCALAHDPASDADRSIVAGGKPIIVSPLHRVRSTTAPPSVQRALLADTLLRQHAPWALTWGALAGLSWLPRVRLGGFVIAPQSWALPEALDEKTLIAWRTASGAPRRVQVGAEDAMLPLDLDRADDRASLLTLPYAERRRAYEIWPPLGRELDESGRRVELICAVVDEGAAEPTAMRNARAEALGVAAPPSDGAIADDWRTIRVYAARERHADLLANELATFIEATRGVKAWFFLPYVEPPGARPHLRVRVRAKDAHTASVLASDLARVFDGAIERGDVAAVEIGSYYPERARYGAALAAVEEIFESDSRAAVDELHHEDRSAEVRVVAAFDALADGLGLSPASRAQRCADALAAYDIDEVEAREELAPAYRVLQRALRERLESRSPSHEAHVRRLRTIRMPRRDAEALLPTLLHLGAVRRCGPDRAVEIRALYLWGRALESMRAFSRPSARSNRSAPRRRAPPRS